MDNNTSISNKIKSVVRVYISDAEVMLFGSRARREAHSESDYDILIIVAQEFSPEEKTPLRTKIRKDLLKEGIRTDILIQNKVELENKRRLPGHIIRNILKEAIVL